MNKFNFLIVFITVILFSLISCDSTNVTDSAPSPRKDFTVYSLADDQTKKEFDFIHFSIIDNKLYEYCGNGYLFNKRTVYSFQTESDTTVLIDGARCIKRQNQLGLSDGLYRIHQPIIKPISFFENALVTVENGVIIKINDKVLENKGFASHFEVVDSQTNKTYVYWVHNITKPGSLLDNDNVVRPIYYINYLPQNESIAELLKIFLIKVQ